MQKIHISVTIDPEILVILKEEKEVTNVSRLIEELLKDYIDTPKESEEMKKKREFIALLNDLKDNYGYSISFNGFSKGGKQNE